jgi:hypothetical protein
MKTPVVELEKECASSTPTCPRRLLTDQHGLYPHDVEKRKAPKRRVVDTITSLTPENHPHSWMADDAPDQVWLLI